MTTSASGTAATNVRTSVLYPPWGSARQRQLAFERRLELLQKLVAASHALRTQDLTDEASLRSCVRYLVWLEQHDLARKAGTLVERGVPYVLWRASSLGRSTLASLEH